MERKSEKSRTEKPRKKRGPNKIRPITTGRKLINRLEASDMLGVSPDTVKRMEKRRGGPLDVVKLNGPQSTTFYRLDQINALIGIAETSSSEQAA
jgi:hypothetical protein